MYNCFQRSNVGVLTSCSNPYSIFVIHESVCFQKLLVAFHTAEGDCKSDCVCSLSIKHFTLFPLWSLYLLFLLPGKFRKFFPFYGQLLQLFTSSSKVTSWRGPEIIFFLLQLFSHLCLFINIYGIHSRVISYRE